MAAFMIVGLAFSSISFFVVFFVKVCAETSRMKICKFVRLDTEPEAFSGARDSTEPERRSQPAISGERLVIEMPKRVA